MKRNRTLAHRLKDRRPPGFTLVELLVVIGILIVLTVMTLSLVNITQDEDRVRSGAAQVRSYLEGARDRAIHAKEPRGVRFLLDSATGTPTCSSMVYIGPPENFSEGRIAIDATTMRTIEMSDALRADWNALVGRGLIPDTRLSGGAAVLRISDSNLLYTVEVSGPVGAPIFRLTKDYSGSPTTPEEYSLQLNPTVLPNQEPRQLPRDVVIDLQNSRLPEDWSGNGYAQMDVLFSPHGTVTGLVASAGVVHLVVAEGVDVFQNRPPGAPTKEGNERVVTVRTQTGSISVHNVDPTDILVNSTGAAGTDNLADDPFNFAARGEPVQ